MFARLGVILGDEPAVAEMLSIKGHAGHRPCILCLDATLYKTAEPLHRKTAAAVPITETKMSAFTLHTPETLQAVLRKIGKYKLAMTADELAIRERALGVVWNSHSIMSDPRLQADPTQQLM